MTAASEPAGSVAICVATHRRPRQLAALLASLDALVLPEPGPAVRIIVVDNDPGEPAEAALGPLPELTRWPLTYVLEPVGGVVAARNRLLAAVPGGVDFVAFVDDDETVSPGWLAALLAAQSASGAQAVQGRVEPRFEIEPPEWVSRSGLFALDAFEEGGDLHFASTNNSLVQKDFLDRHSLRFDMRFNLSGGEDEELFTRLRALGGRIVWAPDALVIDHVPKGRMTLRWMLRRAHRMGNTLGRIAILHRRRRGLRLAKGVGHLAGGIGRALTTGLVSQSERVRGLLAAARGAGALSAFLGVVFTEYSPSAVARDRPEEV